MWARGILLPCVWVWGVSSAQPGEWRGGISCHHHRGGIGGIPLALLCVLAGLLAVLCEVAIPIVCGFA